MDLTETKLNSEAVFDGKLLHARRDLVKLPNGEEATREYIVHPGAVLVIPVLPDGQLVFERQFRYPLNRDFIELPAGKIDPNEDPLVTGQRELLEELDSGPAEDAADRLINLVLARGAPDNVSLIIASMV